MNNFSIRDVINNFSKLYCHSKDARFYYLFINQHCLFQEDGTIPAFAIKWYKDRKKFVISYNSEFLKGKSLELLTLMVIHQILHPWQGHFSLDVKAFLKRYKYLNPDLLNTAMDWEINMLLYHFVLPSLYPRKISELRKEMIENQFALPPEEYLEIPNERDLYYWIGVIQMLYGDDQKEQPQTNGFDLFPETGSMDSEDIFDINTDGEIPTTPIAEKGDLEPAKKQEQAGKETANKQFSVKQEQQQNKKRYTLRAALSDVFSRGTHELGFGTPHILNLTHAVPANIILPANNFKRGFKVTYFIDTSGSMENSKLRNCYDLIKPMLQGLGEIHYCMCDTSIKKYGLLRGKSDFDIFHGGGGTDFKEAVYYLVKEKGTTNFIFYTDGCFPDFEFPPTLNGNEQIWLLVDRKDNFSMPGKIVDLS